MTIEQKVMDRLMGRGDTTAIKKRQSYRTFKIIAGVAKSQKPTNQKLLDLFGQSYQEIEQMRYALDRGDTEEVLRRWFSHLDGLMKFGNQTNADKAYEAMELVIKEEEENVPPA